MATGKQYKPRYDGCTAYYIGPSGNAYYDLLDEHMRLIQLIEKPDKPSPPSKPQKVHERMGRFYLVKHTGYYGLARVDGTGSERWCRNKKEAAEIAERITRREAEAERRQIEA